MANKKTDDPLAGAVGAHRSVSAEKLTCAIVIALELERTPQPTEDEQVFADAVRLTCVQMSLDQLAHALCDMDKASYRIRNRTIAVVFLEEYRARRQ